jgi:hypothetical protein
MLFDRAGIAGAHIHRHRFELFGLFHHGSEERRDRLLARSFEGMEGSTGLKIDEDGYVGMTLFQAELVDTKTADLAQIDGPVFRGEPSFTDLFDPGPSLLGDTRPPPGWCRIAAEREQSGQTISCSGRFL